jgi:hypothetical protein
MTLILEWREAGDSIDRLPRSAQTYQDLILAIEDARKLATEDGISDVKLIGEYRGCYMTLNMDGTWSTS